MKRKTLIALILILSILVLGLFFGVTKENNGGLKVLWVSDTDRKNEINHHAVSISDNKKIVVVPVAETTDNKITSSSCALIGLNPKNGTTLWSAGVKPKSCGIHAMTQPTIADLDNDSYLEVVALSIERALLILNGSDGSEDFRVSMPSIGYGRPTIGNIKSDVNLEVVASDINGNIVVVDSNGTVLWRENLNTTVIVAPIVENTKDGSRIYIGTSTDIYSFSEEGKTRWKKDIYTTSRAYSDINNDGAVEIFTTQTKNLTVLDGRSGIIEWQKSFKGNPKIRVVDDADRDGIKEVFVGLSNGYILSLNGESGEVEWKTQLNPEGSNIIFAPKVGDINKDKNKEIIGVSNGGTVIALNSTTGEEITSYHRKVSIWTFPTIGDINNDMDKEILVKYSDGRVVALDYT